MISEVTGKQALTRAQLKKAAKGFEAILAKQLIETMQKGTSIFGTGTGAGIYQDFFNQSLAEALANRGSFGIAKMVEEQMAPRIEAAEKQTSDTQ